MSYKDKDPFAALSAELAESSVLVVNPRGIERLCTVDHTIRKR